jgi:hypothetical protein
MRKVTQQACDALFDGRTFSSSNTTVTHDNGYTTMLLHGNGIATQDHMNNVLMVNDCGWQTPTTKERLNGVFDMFSLPYYLRQIKGRWYLGKRSPLSREQDILTPWPGETTIDLTTGVIAK